MKQAIHNPQQVLQCGWTKHECLTGFGSRLRVHWQRRHLCALEGTLSVLLRTPPAQWPSQKQRPPTADMGRFEELYQVAVAIDANRTHILRQRHQFLHMCILVQCHLVSLRSKNDQQDQANVLLEFL